MISAIGERIWDAKYRFEAGGAVEASIADTWGRVAHAVASVEKDASRWERAYCDAMSGFTFLPGGRILAGAGTGRQVTLFNCFVSGPLSDSVAGILDALKETAVTMQQGGGIGVDFSTLRPAGAPAVRTGSIASGPLPFMHLWDSLCETMLATSSRRGAMMGTLRCDHPDIEAFVEAKRNPQALHNFNLSVLVTDDLMRAVQAGDPWDLRYPANNGQVVSRLPARALWERIVHAAHETAEPGLLFIDTINRDNNLYYCERISATNPCGEVPLPPYGSCDLGSINLANLVREPFTCGAALIEDCLVEVTATAVRFLDDVIDVSRFPLPQQAMQARRSRRIGLGITGLADLLAMLGLRYDSEAARDMAAHVMTSIRDTAYETSIALAREKGPFAALVTERFLEAPFIRRLPDTLRRDIARYGIRNSHLLAIAPTGTISLLAGNVSSGIEPIFALDARRDIRGRDGHIETVDVRDFAWGRWRELHAEHAPDTSAFVTAGSIPAAAHLAMQARLQPLVDGAISKTLNLPGDATPRDVAEIFAHAHAAGIKGCTVFRPGARHGQVLRARRNEQCCPAVREPT